MLRDVVVILGTEVHPFELGTLCEVFGLDRSEDGLPGFEFAVCAPDPTPRLSAGGLTVSPSHGLDRADSADLLAIPAWAPDREPLQPDVVEVLHAALERGATVLSVCSGAFLLAAAGLLDGRRATCHWLHVDQMRQRYPHVRVEPDRLYVDEGQVVTSAGTAAGIDACLHLVRRELGAEVANGIARGMVVPPHRDGGQAQYVTAPVPTCERNGHDIASLLDWLRAHLDQAHTGAGLAARLHLSTRTFARRFTETTGTSPHLWITQQRILLARHLLELDELDVATIARRSGFGTDEALRHHFTRHLGTTPTAYRQTFSHHLEPAPHTDSTAPSHPPG